MSKGITISPRHGLNPCIPVCFFCGEQKNEIALMGRLKDDQEAPHSAVIDYAPCDKCQANWNMGVPLLRVSHKPAAPGMPPIKVSTATDNRLPDNSFVYPTGQYTVMTKEAVQRIFEADAKIGSPIMLEDQLFDNIIEQAKASGAIDENGDAVTPSNSEINDDMTE